MKTKLILTVAMLIALTSVNLFTQKALPKKDKEGGKDYVGISRYKNAIIHEYNTINYSDFYFGLAEPVRKKFLGHGQFFKKYIKVKGKLMNIEYLISLTEGVLKVYENYKNALSIAGYTIIYTEHNKNSCFYREDFYGGDAGAIAKVNRNVYGVECDKDYYYMVAKGVRDALDVYVSLYIGTGSGYVIVNQSVVETVPLELGLVSADNIALNIKTTGHSIFYDIHFATGSANIDSKSDNQIKQIADYLKKNTNKKYYIVGHTDNVGDFTANMTLSENRAKSVMNELVSKYGVNINQLKAYGIANLSPVTNNTSDKGKARNRRVEIVEQ